MINTQELSTMMEMFMKIFMECDEKAHIAQEERDDKAYIELKQIEHSNATWIAKVGMLLDGRSIRQKLGQYRKMEPEPEQIKMTANAEDAASPINSEEVPTAKKGDNSDQESF